MAFASAYAETTTSKSPSGLAQASKDTETAGSEPICQTHEPVEESLTKPTAPNPSQAGDTSDTKQNRQTHEPVEADPLKPLRGCKEPLQKQVGMAPRRRRQEGPGVKSQKSKDGMSKRHPQVTSTAAVCSKGKRAQRAPFFFSPCVCYWAPIDLLAPHVRLQRGRDFDAAIRALIVSRARPRVRSTASPEPFKGVHVLGLALCVAKARGVSMRRAP